MKNNSIQTSIRNLFVVMLLVHFGASGICADQSEWPRLQSQYEKNVVQLAKLSIYLKSRGHFLLDTEIAQKWLVPTAIVLAGLVAEGRHAALMKASLLNSKLNIPLTEEQKTLARLSPNRRFGSALSAAAFIAAFVYLATEMRTSSELAQLDLKTPGEALSHYNNLLCDTNKLGEYLGHQPIPSGLTGYAPKCM
jgi:hypothetical protein